MEKHSSNHSEMPTFLVEWPEPNEETPSTAGDHVVQSKTDLLHCWWGWKQPIQIHSSHPVTHICLWPNCLLYQREEKLCLQKHIRMSTRPYFVFVYKHTHVEVEVDYWYFHVLLWHYFFLTGFLVTWSSPFWLCWRTGRHRIHPSVWLLHPALLLEVCAATPGFLCGCWVLKFRFPWLCSRYHIHRAISPAPVTLFTITNGKPASRPSRGKEIN